MSKKFNAEKIDIYNQESKDIFSLAFKEKAEITNRLFETLLKNCLHLTLTIDEKIISQLFLIESEVVLDKNYPIYYLYAAATHPSFQGKGYMHELIDYAKEVVIKNNRYGIVLKPANKELFKFYDSCGFSKILYSDIYEYTANNNDLFCNKLTAKEYIEIREKLLKESSHVVLKESLEAGLDNHYFIFGNNNSLTLAERFIDNNTAFIAEHLGDESSLNFALKSLKCEKAIVKTMGSNEAFSVIWLNNIKEPQYNIYHGPCFE